MIAGGGPVVVVAPATVTPCGSPGWTSWSGPTVDGGTDDGTFAFGVMSDGSYGGRIDRLNTGSQSKDADARMRTRVPVLPGLAEWASPPSSRPGTLNGMNIIPLDNETHPLPQKRRTGSMEALPILLGGTLLFWNF